jgi:serine/threonine protein kinase
MKSETLILQEVDNEYVVKCFYIFSDKINYYFVMEFMPGGDLLSLLNHLFLRPEVIFNLQIDNSINSC